MSRYRNLLKLPGKLSVVSEVANSLYIGSLEKLAVLVFSFGRRVRKKKKEVRGRGQHDQLFRRMNAQRKERVQEQRRRERETMTRE